VFIRLFEFKKNSLKNSKEKYNLKIYSEELIENALI